MKLAAPVLALPLLLATLFILPALSPQASPITTPRHATAELVSARINAALEGKSYTLPRD